MGKGRMFEIRERRELLENLKQWIEGWFALLEEKGEEGVTSHRIEGFQLILLEEEEEWFRVAVIAPEGFSLQTAAELCADLAEEGTMAFAGQIVSVREAFLRTQGSRISILAQGRCVPFRWKGFRGTKRGRVFAAGGRGISDERGISSGRDASDRQKR